MRFNASIVGMRRYHTAARQWHSGDFQMVTPLCLQQVVIYAGNVLTGCGISTVSQIAGGPVKLTGIKARVSRRAGYSTCF